MNKRIVAAVAVLALVIGAGLARAQYYPPPFVSSINNNSDAIQVISRATPSAQNTYATPAQITNVPGYVKLTPAVTTACTAGTPNLGCAGYYNTFAANQTYELIVLTGTLSYSYNYTATSPSDGARECVAGSGAGITSVYLEPSGSQIVTSGQTAVTLAANASACWTYSLANLTWDRS